VLVLAYDDPASLEIIQAMPMNWLRCWWNQCPESSARRTTTRIFAATPTVDPKDRYCLVFDEVITGFRIHPGGAQAWFGVGGGYCYLRQNCGWGDADRRDFWQARYLDAIDGGMWHYGDESYPPAETTFFAGTFSRNPLAMASAYAVLSQVKLAGLPLYQQLNQRTTQFAQAVNAFFTAAEVPIRLVNFGSLFALLSRVMLATYISLRDGYILLSLARKGSIHLGRADLFSLDSSH
jgi:hypothetical protein